MSGGRTMRVNDRYGAVGGEVIHVDIVLWRRGDPNATESMGSIEVTNVGPTSPEEGRDFGGERFYEYRMNGGDGITVVGRVRHRRQQGALALLKAVFNDDGSDLPGE